MKNVSYTIEDDVLVLRINLKETHGISASGKSETVATTGGNVDVPGYGVKLGLNCYKAIKK